MLLRVAILMMFVNIYFLFHLFTGKYSIIRYFEYSRFVRDKQAELNDIIINRRNLEKILMKKEPDLEFFDDFVRSNMGFVKPNEIVVIADE